MLLEQIPALRSVLSVAEVRELWVMSPSANPVLTRSTTATVEPLGRKQQCSSSLQRVVCVCLLKGIVRYFGKLSFLSEN